MKIPPNTVISSTETLQGLGPWTRKRRHERVKLDVPLIVALGGGEVLSGRTIDLSEGGIGAIVRGKCAADQVVELQFAVHNGTVPLHIRSVTKYSSDARHGFEFLRLTPDQRSAIENLVESAKQPTTPVQAKPAPGPYKFGGQHAPTCICPVCGRSGGVHGTDCMCDACGGLGGEHNPDCRCGLCRMPPRHHSSDCRCPSCGASG